MPVSSHRARRAFIVDDDLRHLQSVIFAATTSLQSVRLEHARQDNAVPSDAEVVFLGAKRSTLSDGSMRHALTETTVAIRRRRDASPRALIVAFVDAAAMNAATELMLHRAGADAVLRKRDAADLQLAIGMVRRHFDPPARRSDGRPQSYRSAVMAVTDMFHAWNSRLAFESTGSLEL